MATRGQRDPALDAVRAVAVLAMFVAHFAPSGGPGGVLDVSEYVAAPLFAFVIGWAAAIGTDRPGRIRSAIVRGVALLAIGFWLTPLTHQIYVILPWLGLLVVAVALLARLRSRWVLLVALALFTVEPALFARGQDWLTGQAADGLRLTPVGLVAPSADQVLPLAVELVAGGAPYRLTWLLPLALVGVLVQRHVSSGGIAAITALTGWIVSVLLLGAGHADLVTLDPYSGRYAVLVLDVALVLAIGLTGYWSARWVPWLGAVLGPCGAMALSVYVAQVLGSEAWVRGTGSVTDNSWLLLGLMLGGGLLVPLVWRSVLGSTVLAPGPLETPLALISGSRAARVRERPSTRRRARAS